MEMERMDNRQNRKDEISVYIEDQEYMANTYVVKCFSVMMGLYTLTVVLNLLNIFYALDSFSRKDKNIFLLFIVAFLIFL